MKKALIIISLLVTCIVTAQSKKYIQYTVKDNETITSISKKFGLTPYDILKLNPDAQDGINIDQILVLPNTSFTKVNETSVVTSSNLSVTNTVAISKPKHTLKDSISNGYLFHRVKAGETVYSLAKKYKYKKKKVLKLNNLSKRADLSIGQLLKFPTDLPNPIIESIVINNNLPTIITTDVNEFDGDFVNYEVKAQETLYSIAKNNELTQQQILDLNPSIKVNGLREYDIIKLPVVKDMLTGENEQLKNRTSEFTYIVPAQETFYNLMRKYNVSKEQLLELNPILKEGLKEGLEIKIPILENKNILNREHNFESKTLELVLMLPFNAEKNKEVIFENNKLLDICTDFYLGSKLALADIKKTGLSVNVHVFDTKKDVNVVRNLAQTPQITNADVIIGPFFYGNVKEIAKNRLIKAPIISPLSQKDHAILGNKNLVQTRIINKDKVFSEAVVAYIKDNINNENLILVSDDEPETIINKNRIKSLLLSHDSINTVKEYILSKGKLNLDKLKALASKKDKNWVLVLTKEDIFLESFIETFGGFDSSYDLTLFSVKKSKNHHRLKNIHLSRVHYHYPEINFTDKQLIKTKKFIDNYKAVYKNYPSDNVLKGYDITYDALTRLALDNRRESFNENVYEGLNTMFSYSSSYNGISNKAVQIVRYNNFSIEKAK